MATVIGVDVHQSRVHAVAMDGSEVLASTSVEGEDLSVALAELVSILPGAAATSTVTVCRSVNRVGLITPARLSPIAVVRITPTASDDLPPMTGWPAELRTAISARTHLCRGGHEFSGREVATLDRDALARVAEDCVVNGIRAVAVTAAFSPVNAGAEQAAAEFLAARVPGVQVSLSHQVGGLGLLERENATILNASLLASADVVSRRVTLQVRAVLPRARVHFIQNDGTASEVEFVRRQPIHTLWAGEASGLRGAAILRGASDCVVVDARQANVRVGVVQDGHPVQGHREVDVAGVRINMRHPAMTEVPDAAGVGSQELLLRTIAATDPSHRLPIVAIGAGMPDVASQLGPRFTTLDGHPAAVGAALSPIGAEVMAIVGGDEATRRRGRQQAERRAVEQAILAGAMDGTVRIHSVEEVPLAYLPGDMMELRVRAVGDAVPDPPG